MDWRLGRLRVLPAVAPLGRSAFLQFTGIESRETLLLSISF